jgi:uncharacterized protein (DUF302 family)
MKAVDGLITLPSSFGTKETMDRLAGEIASHDLEVFARIDHAAGAAEAGLKLRPTMLILFGNPRGGTPLMEAAQTAGIDLPLKALVWDDAAGKTWLSYNEPAWIARRHGAPDAAVGVNKLSAMLTMLCRKATTAFD